MDAKRRITPLVVVVAIALFAAIPFFYILSIGPMYCLVAWNMLPTTIENRLVDFYEPLYFVASKSEWAIKSLLWYEDKWSQLYPSKPLRQ
jgi:hypothetical protein